MDHRYDRYSACFRRMSCIYLRCSFFFFLLNRFRFAHLDVHHVLRNPEFRCTDRAPETIFFCGTLGTRDIELRKFSNTSENSCASFVPSEILCLVWWRIAFEIGFSTGCRKVGKKARRRLPPYRGKTVDSRWKGRNARRFNSEKSAVWPLRDRFFHRKVLVKGTSRRLDFAREIVFILVGVWKRGTKAHRK